MEKEEINTKKAIGQVAIGILIALLFFIPTREQRTPLTMIIAGVLALIIGIGFIINSVGEYFSKKKTAERREKKKYESDSAKMRRYKETAYIVFGIIFILFMAYQFI